MRLAPDLRQAVYLTLATWMLSGSLYLIPFHVFQGGAGLYVVASVANICTMGALLTGGVYLVARRARGRAAGTRLAAMGAAVVLASATLALYDATTSFALAETLEGPTRLPSFSLRATNNFVALVWQFALLGAAFTVLEANNLARARERELAEARQVATQAEAAASAARLAALRYQLNPHFLFNTLNAVSSLVVTRRNEEADEMLSRLSGFLRATLAADPGGMTSVEDELATLQHYLEIEAVRFDDRLAVEFVCPAELRSAALPSFLLQPLVENAIKYAVAPADRAVTIRVEVARDSGDLIVRVADDGAGSGRAPAHSGTGVGLANVRQRLQVLYGSRATLEAGPGQGGYVAAIRLPLGRSAAELEKAA
jgi:hypothetical protein